MPSRFNQSAVRKPLEFDTHSSFTPTASHSELDRDPWEFLEPFKIPSDWWFVIASAQATKRWKTQDSNKHIKCIHKETLNCVTIFIL